MRGLDDIDREILRLLLEDARRPYSEIAEAVDLSPPAVSDRIERLQDIGLLQRFTVDIDRSMLEEGVPVLVSVDAVPGTAQRVREGLADTDAVEYVFRTVDDRVVFTATVAGADVDHLVTAAVQKDDIRDYEVSLLADTDWSPRIGGAELAADCVECGNTVTAEGETATLDGEVYHFCCENCRTSFVEKYDRLSDSA
ncbi:AsnC family transcriptional regulator [Salinibaculum rarum]|uniref:AsnC family transcriptional regulator n=1 Tax=Salinibaculum rarum TaxID=3058903 RepID=UPI00265E6056|nr:AsnC family transcriptional regulator [Salinibaculum sp. KK48]